MTIKRTIKNIYHTEEYTNSRISLVEKVAIFGNPLEDWEDIKLEKPCEDFTDVSLSRQFISMGEGYFKLMRLIVRVEGEKSTLQFGYIHNYNSVRTYLFRSRDKDYLLFQQDYQGFSIFNITDKSVSHFVDEQKKKGAGFCIVGILDIYEEDGKLVLRGEGCYWACPFEDFTITLSDPDDLDTVELETTPQDPVYQYDDEDEG